MLCYYAEFGVEDLEKEEERKKPLKTAKQPTTGQVDE